MLQFIVDGYNLAHKIDKVKKSDSPCHRLLSFISSNKLTGSLKNKVLVVFDGNRPPYSIADFGYQVLFSRKESADDLIVTKVKKIKNKKEVLLVSDDRELGYKVKMLGAKVCRVNQFIAKGKKIAKIKKEKEISYSDQQEITAELRKIWLDKENNS